MIEATPLASFLPRYVLREVARGTDHRTVRRSRAAVLFADISGFTPLSEALGQAGPHGAEELTRLLNDYFGVMVELVEAHGGTVCGFGGDALTAMFPIRGAGSSAAGRALTCASQMQSAMPRWESIETGAGRFGLTMKVGVAAGSAITFSVGDRDTRLEHVVAGSAVDRSVAAEHEAEAGEIVAHESVRAERLPRVRRRTPRPPALHDDALPVLRSYLHPAIAERVESGREAFVDEHRHVTVLFVGLDGFDFDEDEAAPARLQDMATRMVEVVLRFGGHVRQVETGDKGSKLLVLFGAPVAYEDDEVRALRCALELRELHEPRPRIGVSAGRAFCGVVGSETRREYAAVGDTVNLAARLMQRAAPGDVLVSGVSAATLALFTAARLDPIAVKGKASRIDVAAIAEWAPMSAGVRDATPFVGRERELVLGDELIVRVLSGKGGVLVVTGEPGIGKSRLCVELIKRARVGGLDVFEGACDPTGTGTSYLPWQPVFRSLLGLGDSARRTRIDDVRAAVAAIHPSLSRRAPLLGPAIRAQLPEDHGFAAIEPEVRSQMLRALLVDLLVRSAAKHPMTLHLDDVHWVDSLSAELLEEIARVTSAHPILLVVSHRPTVRLDPILALPHAKEIALGALDESAVAELVLSHDSDADPDTVRHLAERTEGNPLFISELLELTSRAGISLSDPKEVSELEVPTSLGMLALARIDQLEERDKPTIKAASVVGRTFSRSWIERSFDELGGPGSVPESVARLVRAELVLHRGAVDEYVFRHASIRDAAYESLSVALRRDLHERLALYVEHTYGDVLGQYVDVLAYHFSESANVDKQRVYLRLAGDGARAAFANETAIGYFERLLAVAEGGERVAALLRLGEVVQHVGEWARAETIFRDALAEAPDELVAARAELALGSLLARTDSFDEAQERLERARSTFEAHGSSEVLRALEALAHLSWQTSDYDASLRYSADQLQRARDAGATGSAAMAHEQTGLVHLHRGARDDARRAFADALDGAQEVGDVRLEIHALNDLAGLEWESGRHDESIGLVGAALDLCEEIGYRHAAVVLAGNAAELLRERGELPRALALAASTMAAAADMGDWTGVMNQIGNSARTLHAMGELGTAHEQFQVAVSLARRFESPYFLCEYLHFDAAVRRELGDIAGAAAQNDDALCVAKEIDRADVVTAGEQLALVLRRESGELAGEDAARALEELAEGDDEIAAAAAYLAWTVEPTRDRRLRALELCRELHERTPKLVQRTRYADLSGGPDLAEPPPLLSLGDRERGDVTVEELLARTAAVVAAMPSA